MRKAAGYRQEIIRLTRNLGQVARPYLAQTLQISLPTVTNLVKDLMAQGLLIEEGFGESQGGRRAALLKLNPRHACAIGVEVSLSGIRAVLLDLSGSLLAEQSAPGEPMDSPQTTLNTVAQLIAPLVRTVPADRLKGIGVGVAGLVNREAGVCIKFPQLDAWVDVPIAEVLGAKFHLDTIIENDVQASTVAEHRYGAARGVDTFLYLHLGHGIRLGTVLDGAIFHGVHGRAGELGHIVVVEDGPICYCGNYGCLESVASPRAIVEQVREAMSKGVESDIAALAGGNAEAITVEMVLGAAAAGDRLALNLVERVGGYIGRVMANLANLVDPSMFILAGRMTRVDSPLVEIIERTFRRAAMPSARDMVDVKRSAFPASPCARGAATLVFDRMFEQLELA